MARKRNHGNGQFNESLQALKQAQVNMLQALANMQQNLTVQSQIQTAFLARMAESEAEIVKLRRQAEETNARIDQRFTRIETILAELPERVHRQFGFQPPRPPAE